MTKQDTGFDAFFNAVTSSPEFKNITTKDWGKEFKEGLDNMGEEIKKASSITSSFKDTFDTPEVREAGNSYTSKPYINRTEDEGKKKKSIDIKYFEKKNPATWGFNGVAGMDALKLDLTENFIKPLKFKFLIKKLEKEGVKEDDKKSKIYNEIHEAYKKFGVTIPTGMLFYGPPGTGKTFITKKLAQELGAGMIKKSAGEFGSSYVHATAQNIKKFFDEAKQASEKGPIILFLDEIDSLVSKRTNSADGNKAEEVSQFLQEFNGLEDAPNLIVIAATNRPDHLDSAILRSGRFDKKIYVGIPDAKARKELFKIYIEKEKRPNRDIDYSRLSELTKGYVAADIEAICDEVARDASKNILDLASSLDGENVDYDAISDQLDDHIITMDLLIQAIEETTSSLKYVDMKIYEDFDLGESQKKVRV